MDATHNWEVDKAMGKLSTGYLYDLPQGRLLVPNWDLRPHPGYINDCLVDHESKTWHSIFYIRKLEDEMLGYLVDGWL